MSTLNRGIIAAVLTPVDHVGMINVERYCRHARWLLRHGCHGLGVFGSTSETQSFSVQERQAALEAYVGAELPPERMIVGVGCCARTDTMTLARHALDLGITKLIALPPFFYKGVSDEGIYRSFAEIVDGIADERLELYLYHFPQMSGVPIPHAVIDRLLSMYPSTLKGVKDSSGNWEHTRSLIEGFPSLSIYAGADQLLLDNLVAGGAGTFSAAANINAPASREVFDAFFADKMKDAEEGMKLVRQVRDVVSGFPPIPSLKYVIADGQKDDVWRVVRPPLVDLDSGSGERLLRDLEAVGFVYDPDLYSVASA
ncbi:MAG: dihydrodipicolinate synthase family protein [Pseudomonadota bacterium]